MAAVRSFGSTSTSNCRQPGSLREWAAFSSALAMKLSTFSGLMRRSTDRTNISTPFQGASLRAGMICQNPGMKNPGGSRGTAFLLLALATLFWAGNWVLGRALRGPAPSRAPGRDPAQRGPPARAVLSRRGAVPVDDLRGAEDHHRGERSADQ